MCDNESELRSSLQTFKSQLEQVTLALTAAGHNDELSKLESDLKELISLTEDSLLSLLKSKLLSQLDDGGQENQASTSKGSVHLASSQRNTRDSSSDDSSSSDEERANTRGNDTADSSDLQQIVGTKCRALHSHAWGDLTYHNAIIVALEPLLDDQEPRVKVMLTQPTHRSLVPCQFFLEDRCNFGDQCKFSHGQSVEVKTLREYIEPDHESLVLESRCLACHPENRVWYPATVVEVSQHTHSTGQEKEEDGEGGHPTMQVMFDRDHSLHTLNMADVVPLVDRSGASNDVTAETDDVSGGADDAGGDIASSGSDSEGEELPVYLWRPGQCNEKMADWEKHTKGVGSRIMQRLGYVMGQGLGRNAEGRAEPVPIQLLPAGKSLDKIMELKERAGDRDLYDVMRKRKRKQKAVDAKAAASYQCQSAANVFDFINHKLGDSKANPRSLARGSSNNASGSSSKNKETRHISVSELKTKSEKNLNIQMFQTAEEIRTTERNISSVKTSLARNKGEPLVAKRLQEKLSGLESYLRQLRTSQTSLQSHKDLRRDRKKLTIF